MDAGKQILKWVLITLISFTTFNLFISSKYTVEREELINVPPNFVYSEVVDLHKWKYWSVWIKEDTTITVEYISNNIGENSKMILDSGDGTVSLEIKSISPTESINTELFFEGMPPAYGFWKFEDLGESTKVSWKISGEMPFFMSFMTLFMEKAIGSDFEEGLKSLKDWCESSYSIIPKSSELDILGY